MGGKTKNTQRTKNNVKPSSSSRSAELLGQVPNFVGFSVHSELGLVPFAPGFTTTENLTESFDANISPQLQMIFRKMSKKDCLTKKKALQEFIEVINSSTDDDVKIILPLWPKYYQNLAIDTEHNVRELSQTVLQLLVTKCKKNVAPFLKQLVPVWIASHFDNYAPAASIARNSFRETFAAHTNRVQEVCLHSQKEIMEYTVRNLTFHTPTTILNGKTLQPEEAEQKYQRIVMSSLKELSFFMEHTLNSDYQPQTVTSLETLITHQKFWSFSKHKVPVIKAAWFEFLYHCLQSKQMLNFLPKIKSQAINITFQNFDDSDPLVSPHVWGCILLLQTTFPDWYNVTNFQKTIVPKLSFLLRTGFKQNAESIGPNMLPFLSHLIPECFQEISLYVFYKRIFDDMKTHITQETVASKANLNAVFKAYFECLRFLIQKISIEEETLKQDMFIKNLIKDYIVEPTEYYLCSGNNKGNNFFLHTSTFIAFLTERQTNNTTLHEQLLQQFWERLNEVIIKNMEDNAVENKYLENTVQLMNHLYSTKQNFVTQKVKFVEQSDVGIVKLDQDREMNSIDCDSIRMNLKNLVSKLMSFCINNIKAEKSSAYVNYMRDFTKLYSDKDFYKSLTPAADLKSTLNLLLSTINLLDDSACDSMIDLIFEVLQLIEKIECFEFINKQMLNIKTPQVKKAVIQKLLSYPMCIEPEVRTILSEPAVKLSIEYITREVVNGSIGNLSLLSKCFFQTNEGEIPITSATVDSIFTILSEVLTTEELNDDVDACCSFIAQNMGIICSHASKSVRADVFIKLFKFTLERSANEFISEDTLWEITTSWQDALLTQDIIIDEQILNECGDVVNQSLLFDDFSLISIDNKATTVSQFILCLLEKITNNNDRNEKLDAALNALLLKDEKTVLNVGNLKQFCLFIECINGQISTDITLSQSCVEDFDMKSIFERTFLNFVTIYKLVCKEPEKQHAENELNDDDISGAYYDPTKNLLTHWSELLLTQILKSIYIAAIGDSLISNTNLLEDELTTLMLALSEKVKLFMGSDSTIVSRVKELIMDEINKETDISPCRCLKYLIYYQQYAQFDENATIVLSEDISDNFIAHDKLKAYLNCLQYLLPDLSQSTFTLGSPIMQKVPTLMWIKASVFKCLIKNNFSGEYNNVSDNLIVTAVLQIINDISESQHTQKDLLLFNMPINKQLNIDVINTVEYINLLSEIINNFSQVLTIKNWDVIRIGLSSWVLSVAKSVDFYTDPKTILFIVSVYKLFAALTKFINLEKIKSSSELLTKVIDEWEKVFKRDVNLVLFKSFYRLLKKQIKESCMSFLCFVSVMDEILPAIELIDYSEVFKFHETSKDLTLDEILNFLFENLRNSINSVKITSLEVLKQLSLHFISKDTAALEKKIDSCDDDQTLPQGYFLHRFEIYIKQFEDSIQKYRNEFSFKLTEIEDFEDIDVHIALPYLLLWDCIIHICAISSSPLRAQYTKWITDNRYEENILHFLFRAMPEDILKNYDTRKNISINGFMSFNWTENRERNFNLKKYACYLYVEFLRKLPAVVRKWWNCSPPRPKSFVDKLTTNYVSELICKEELKAITHLKDKHENMQVTVHLSTREVFAIYSIDEVRMELVITLPLNYPLNSAKAECGKQIGGRASQRNIGMQLTLFMTAQNGRIFDGLTMWKNDLDKKFEGVEKCYICYNVIHQDTCQLPKLTCKTCKKKYHGPCLYKWFTTSSKSTCPICRNVF